MAKIRHLAFFSDNPEKLAEFYTDVFGMEIKARGKASVWLSDGYLDIALLKRGDLSHHHPGLNHFGITIEEDEKQRVYRRLEERGQSPVKPPPDRSYVEDYAKDVRRQHVRFVHLGREGARGWALGVQGTFRKGFLGRLRGNRNQAVAEVRFLEVGLAAAAACPEMDAFLAADREPLVKMLLAGLEIEHRADFDRAVVMSDRPGRRIGIEYRFYDLQMDFCEELHGYWLSAVNRHSIGTPDRHPKGTPPSYVLND